MSDREVVLECAVYKRPFSSGDDDDKILIFRDGDSGTWRLWFDPSASCVDLTLVQLRDFHAQLTKVLADIEADPDTFNAEVRRDWGKSEE